MVNATQRPMREVALVIGATGGLGCELCMILKQEGAQVIVAGRNIQALQVLVEMRRADRAVVCDLASPESVGALSREITDVSLFIVASGAARSGPFLDQRPSDLEDETAVNAISIMRLVHAFGRQMVAGGRGCIVLIGSTAAARPAPHLAAYSASKAFLLQLTKALAVEWRPHGVRIVYLVTGPIATLFAERAGLPSPRRGRDPAKVAAAVLAVCRSGRSGVAFSDWGARVRALLYAHLPDAFLGTMALGSEASSS